ncbi:MAG TPA: hypothetical protein VGO59_17240 [Verrucomicrobiae bacterium]|jgi:hypothetical protein
MASKLHTLLFVFLAIVRGPAVFAQTAAANEINSAAGAAVKQLLESGDASRFALEIVAGANDLAEQRLSNTVTHVTRPWPFTPESVEDERKKVAAKARLFLGLAGRLGVDASRITFRVKRVQVASPPAGAAVPPEVGVLPYAPKIKVVLQGDSTIERLAGEYVVELDGAVEFSKGWRIYEGIRWAHVPEGLAGLIGH